MAGFDPAVERVILKCLEKDPRLRPSSALQVASALPGGDPLAAALAAGETPSPEMVAAAGEEGAVRPAVAWSLLGAVLATGIFIIALARFSTDLALGPPSKSPDSLADRARDLVRQFRYEEHPADSSWWFSREYDYLRYRALHEPSPKRIRELEAGEPGPWSFFYRQSPRLLVPDKSYGFVSNQTGMVSADDPPNEISGMVMVNLDTRGRLRAFRAVPPQIDRPGDSNARIDWGPLFREADLDPGHFASTQPKWVPPAPYDTRSEWEGSSARHPEVPLHVTAAGYRGKPIYFGIAGPWERPQRMGQPTRSFRSRIGGAVFVIVVFSLLLAGVVFARRNIRLGRGDRRGALQISTYVFAASMIAWLLRAHHVPDVRSEWSLLALELGEALLGVAFAWVSYIALEPYVRRRWPDLLISWNRLLAGRFGDPLVGRDVLVGALIGAAMAALIHVSNALPAWFDVPGMTPVPPSALLMRGASEAASFLVNQLGEMAFNALGIMSFFFLSASILRKKWLAAVALGLLNIVLSLSGENLSIELPFAILQAALLVFVVLRLGLVAVAVAGFISVLLQVSPITLDFSQWYAGHSLFALAIFAGIALYGFRTALGRRPVFGAVVFEE